MSSESSDFVQSYTAFENHKLLLQGNLVDVVLKTKRHLKANPQASIFVFSDLTGKQMDFDLRGSEKDVTQRLRVYLQPQNTHAVDTSGASLQPGSASPGPGRPKLGVVAREVSLLPRHWEWLSTQSGGASAILRRLVESEMKGSTEKDKIKQAQERTYKFLATMAGNFPNYEEALRALFAKDKKRFIKQMAGWAEDVKSHALYLSAPIFK